MLGAEIHSFPKRPLPLNWLSVMTIEPFGAFSVINSHASSFVEASLE